ncbi:hypothetical protein LTR91_010989 [Friedmanniomyces endolithicus]|uniref:Mitochondrial resolvase Ydc2 catalytic domain-containing protein n=1 Tax=Friedmanniomyces endolithicus TaxID=329885 RepID=A0AAN6KI19_9PEZI|nr:hypothetical protein LTR94_006681 [Friedmanniomyces endolithicus]KAK0770375.1 hypothetical protein LTR59_016544 [Friedmanniomyces endolithicus]KAK0801843.1 hypothetical protein LTR38_006695 [Friedmanniomyces endolithicus]KAK0851605.1 hypothetical protein LTS02_012710 [Friedmanniomyces endolithicus]KAK0858647.1 hypothetical protein LTR03_000072 [Friedmanniomyces endolithicus]
MSSKLLASLKLSQLKHAAFLTGLPSAGTKADVTAVLESNISTRTPVQTSTRIVSVDMGIRNLAYCVLDVPTPSLSHASSTKPSPLKVLEWKRIDLLHPSAIEPQKPPTSSDTQVKHSTKKPAPIPASAFTPSNLSHTALSLSRTLLSHAPTTILIERQRFRSGGGPAIQEWTVRVNMLEAMLWACLTTLRQTSSLDRTLSRTEAGSGAGAGEFPAVFEVLPARVAGFWVGEPGVSLRMTAETFTSPSLEGRRIDPGALTGVSSSSGRKRVQKKDKVAVVRSWLDENKGNGKGNGNGDGNPDVSLVFSGEAAKIAKAFAAPNGRSSSSRGTIEEGKGVMEESEERMGKRDDLADCLLQAVAWVRWGENRDMLAMLLRS